MATEMKVTEKNVIDLINNDYTLDMLIKEMSASFRKRQNHKDYLNAMKKGTEGISAIQPILKDELKSKQSDLNTYLFNTKQFNVQFNFPIQERRKIKILQLKDLVEKKKDKVKFDKLPPNVTFEVSVRFRAKKRAPKKCRNCTRKESSTDSPLNTRRES